MFGMEAAPKFASTSLKNSTTAGSPPVVVTTKSSPGDGEADLLGAEDGGDFGTPGWDDDDDDLDNLFDWTREEMK